MADELREGLAASAVLTENAEAQGQGTSRTIACNLTQSETDALLVCKSEVPSEEPLLEEPDSPLGTALRRISRARAWKGSGEALRVAEGLRVGLADVVTPSEAEEVQQQGCAKAILVGLTQSELDAISIDDDEAEPAEALVETSWHQVPVGTMLHRLRRVRAFEGEAKRQALAGEIEAEVGDRPGSDVCEHEAPDTSEDSESDDPCHSRVRVDEELFLMKRRRAFSGEVAAREAAAVLLDKSRAFPGLGTKCMTQEELDALSVQQDEEPIATCAAATAEEFCKETKGRDARSPAPRISGEGKGDSPCSMLDSPGSPRRFSRFSSPSSPGRGGA